MNFIILENGRSVENEVLVLLNNNGLPTIDIKDKNVKLFIGRSDDRIVGTVGVEKYSKTGLLRSLAVADEVKNKGIGNMLLNFLIDWCLDHDVNQLYLLTTTADKYFAKFGFRVVDRNDVPEIIRQTREFKDICPASAVVMFRQLD